MLRLEHVSKRYGFKKVLNDISISFPDHGLIGIVGMSGCGKTTLMNIIGGIDHDFTGQLIYNEKSVNKCLNRYRRKYVSFIFQHFYLIMWLNVFNNIRIPHFFYKQPQLEAKLPFKNNKVSSLSLGQRQKATYWRCLLHCKDILLCDEPTGSLDHMSAIDMMMKLKELSKDRLVIIVSHDLNLIHQYCDEVYEMQDGEIINHQLLSEISSVNKTTYKEKRMLFSHIKLSLYSLLSHKRQSLQLILGLSLALLSILITFTLSRTLEKEMQNYLYSLVPPSLISFQSNQHQNISLDDIDLFLKHPEIKRTQLFLDDYELLGVGFVKERYQESQTLLIGDDSSPYDQLQLKYGRYPNKKEEILISYSTAKHLANNEDIQECIGKSLFAWYKHQNDVLAIEYHIVGITQNSTVVDTLYQQPNAYISLIKDVFNDQKLYSHFGVIYVDPNYNRENVMNEFKEQYKDYDFLLSGETMSHKVSDVMDRVEIVLMVFSLLAILSSIFLIGEVMFLNVLQKRKDFAIMICFGARMIDLIKLSLYESLELLLVAWLVVVALYYQFLIMCEMFVKELFVGYIIKLSFDFRLVFVVFCFSILLIFMSQLLPMISTMRMNTVEALRE